MAESHAHDRHHRRQLIMHLTAAIAVILKGIAKVTVAGGLVKGSFILVLGAVMLWMALRHQWLEKRFPRAVPFFFLFEAIVVGIIAFASWGKTYAWLYVAATVLYVFAFVKNLRKTETA